MTTVDEEVMGIEDIGVVLMQGKLGGIGTTN